MHHRFEQVARLRRGNPAARFSVTRNVLSNSKHTLLLPFSAVTEKPSGNSKDTLLISREIKKSASKRIRIYAVIPALKASFPDAQAAQKKNRSKVGYKSEHYLSTQGTKAGFSLSRNADHSVNSMPICVNYSQISLRYQ